MGFNLGIGLGAAAESGIKTYERLTEQEMRDLQAKKLRKEFADENAFDASVAKNSKAGQSDAGAVFDKGIDYGDADTNKAVKAQLATLPPEQQEVALRSYAGSTADKRTQASALPVEGEEPATGAPVPKQGIDLAEAKVSPGAERSHSETMRAVLEDMKKSGNTQGIAKAAAIYKLSREIQAADETDQITKEAQDTYKAFTAAMAKGPHAVVSELGEKLAEKGVHLRAVTGPKGEEGIAVLGPDGKTERVLTNKAEIVTAANDALMRDTLEQMVRVTGLPAKDVIAMRKDLQHSELFRQEIAQKREMLPLLVQQIQASIGASHASAAHSAAATADLSNRSKALGNPIGKMGDENGPVVFNNPKGGGLVDQNGKPLPEDAVIVLNGEARKSPPGVGVTQLNTVMNGEPVVLDKEVTYDRKTQQYKTTWKYQDGTVVDDPKTIAQAQKNAIKPAPDMTKAEEMRYKQYLDESAGKPLAEKQKLAADYNLPPRITGLPAVESIKDKMAKDPLPASFWKSATDPASRSPKASHNTRAPNEPMYSQRPAGAIPLDNGGPKFKPNPDRRKTAPTEYPQP